MSGFEWLDLIALILTSGLLTFLATQLVKRSKWPARVNLALSLAMAFAFAAATLWLSGDILGLIDGWSGMTAGTLLAFMALVWTTATVWYRIVFKDAKWAADLASWPGS